jgi:NAD(P)-dependent dehydrogenase (short-subunit alcohol dehydrogenase family)
VTDTHGRIAVVQGASRGLGLALVSALLERRDTGRVLATARQPAASTGLAALGVRYGTRLVCEQIDVGDEASIASAAVRISEVVPRIDWLVNCAGVLHDGGLRPEKRLDDVDPECLRRSFEVNAFGPLLVAKHLLSLLRQSEAGLIANVSARVGSIEDNRSGGWYGYRASKAAQNMFTRTLAIELRRRAPNVTCVALHPGTVATELSEPFTRGLAPERLFAPHDAALKLIEVMRSVTTEDSGSFLDWARKPIPW